MSDHRKVFSIPSRVSRRGLCMSEEEPAKRRKNEAFAVILNEAKRSEWILAYVS